MDGVPNDKPTKVGPDITGLDVGVRTRVGSLLTIAELVTVGVGGPEHRN